MGTQALQLEPLDASFGATGHGLQLRDLDDATFAELHEVWLEYALLIFPAQFLKVEEQDRFARRFGALEFGASPLTNVRRDGSVRSEANDDIVRSLRGNQGWHMDSTYMPVQAKGAVFSAEIVPTEGGETGWADMRAAYAALDDAVTTRVDSLNAHHSIEYSQRRAELLPGQNPDGGYSMYGYHDGEVPLRPLVKIHPDTGVRALAIGRHAHNIVGLGEQESEALLDALAADACRPDRTYHHAWKPGDAVIWDNRCLMHRGRPWDMSEPRRMWHTRIAGDPATETALNYR